MMQQEWDNASEEERKKLPLIEQMMHYQNQIEITHLKIKKILSHLLLINKR